MADEDRKIEDWSKGMSVEMAAETLGNMTPRDAIHALLKLPVERENEVLGRIFDVNFKFFADMEVEKIFIRSEYRREHGLK